MQTLSLLSDEAVLAALERLSGSHRKIVAQLIVHLGEMDDRRLYAKKGYPSLFAYCVERLGFSEDEACRRIEAARMARTFPMIVGLVEQGAVTLTVLGLLKPHLTEDNHAELLSGVAGASVRDARQWLAERFPRPDVPDAIRRCPGTRGAPARQTDPMLAAEETASERLGPGSAGGNVRSVSPTGAPGAPPAPLPTHANVVENRGRAAPAPARIDEKHVGSVEPLSRERFLVKVTVSRAARDKIERARDLMRHRNPRGDLEVVLERAVDALLRQLEKTRFGKTDRPRGATRGSEKATGAVKAAQESRQTAVDDAAEESRQTAVDDAAEESRQAAVDDAAQESRQTAADEERDVRPRRERISSSVRRQVAERDGERCSFVAPDGRRCESRGFLEFDHRRPVGVGGGSDAANVRLLCRSHNSLLAELVYGTTHVREAILRARRR